jgi:hypothetical protein
VPVPVTALATGAGRHAAVRDRHLPRAQRVREEAHLAWVVAQDVVDLVESRDRVTARAGDPNRKRGSGEKEDVGHPPL